MVGLLSLVERDPRKGNPNVVTGAQPPSQSSPEATPVVRLDPYRTEGRRPSSDEKKRAVLDVVLAMAPVGIAVYDDQFVCVQMNDQLAEMNGVSVADSVGRHPAEYIPELWPSIGHLFDRALDEPIWDIEVVGTTRAQPGVERCWLTSYNPIDLSDGRRGFVAVASEITDRRRLEEAAFESEAELASVFLAIDEGFCLCEIMVDDLGKAINWRYLKVNPQFEEMSGLSDVVGRTVLELIPDLEVQWIERFGRVALGGEVLRFEQGAEPLGRWFDVFATPVGVAGRFAVVFKDETSRRLQAEQLRHTARLNEFRAEFTETLRSEKDAVKMQRRAANLIAVFLGADGVFFAQIEAGGEFGTVVADYHGPESVSVVGRHRLDDYGVEVMKEFRAGVTVQIDDVASDPRLGSPERALNGLLGIGSYILSPVLRSARVAGGMLVRRPTKHAWTSDDRELVDEFAQRTLLAIDSLMTEVDAQKRRRRAEMVAKLLVDLELQTTFESQAQHLVDVLSTEYCDYASVEIPQATANVVATAHTDPDRAHALGEARRLMSHSGTRSTNAAIAASFGEARLFPELTRADLLQCSEGDDYLEALIFRLGPRSHAVVPLPLGGGNRGALLVGVSRPDAPLLDASDLEFLQDMAMQIGVVIAATRLRREEHDIAQRLQRALLPDEILWNADLDIAARYHAASAMMEVGGDWYDSFAWPDGRVGLMVGDVVGHNLESAAIMGRLRAGVSAVAANLAPSSSALLETLQRVADGPGGTPFATAVCAVIDPTCGLLTYSSAGHPPMLVLRANGSVLRLSAGQTPPLTPMQRPARPEIEVSLSAGDLLVMYSDGLVERRHEDFNIGIARLEAALLEVRHLAVHDIAERVVARMGSDLKVEDDVVIVCVRYQPAVAVFERVFPATRDQLGVLRRDLRAWAPARNIAPNVLADLLLGVGEAATNSVEHAYGPTQIEPTVKVRVTDHGTYLVALVSDEGTLRKSTRPRGTGGRGTPIMSSISTHFARRTSSQGTAVTMSFPNPTASNEGPP